MRFLNRDMVISVEVLDENRETYYIETFEDFETLVERLRELKENRRSEKDMASLLVNGEIFDEDAFENDLDTAAQTLLGFFENFDVKVKTGVQRARRPLLKKGQVREEALDQYCYCKIDNSWNMKRRKNPGKKIHPTWFRIDEYGDRKAYVCTNCFCTPDQCQCVELPKYLVEIDEDILPIVKKINDKGYDSRFCCSGHFREECPNGEDTANLLLVDGLNIYDEVSGKHRIENGKMFFYYSYNGKEDFINKRKDALQRMEQFVDSLPAPFWDERDEEILDAADEYEEDMIFIHDIYMGIEDGDAVEEMKKLLKKYENAVFWR